VVDTPSGPHKRLVRLSRVFVFLGVLLIVLGIASPSLSTWIWFEMSPKGRELRASLGCQISVARSDGWRYEGTLKQVRYRFKPDGFWLGLRRMELTIEGRHGGTTNVWPWELWRVSVSPDSGRDLLSPAVSPDNSVRP
jgi:hypothetical protein